MMSRSTCRIGCNPFCATALCCTYFLLLWLRRFTSTLTTDLSMQPRFLKLYSSYCPCKLKGMHCKVCC
uniref:Uncharacterized protein n=1 Tax=Arundo donax TaxID=35708 RepID=A0A0A9A5Z1_ARUDO